MNINKKHQFESRISSILSQLIFNELNNEKANKASITKVSANKNNSIIDVYVSFYQYPEQSFFELKKAASFLRKRLATNLDVRHCPEIHFFLDKQFDESLKWEKKFEELNKKEN